MARDSLAPIRGQQPSSDATPNSYPMPISAGGPSTRGAHPSAHRDERVYEMADISNSTTQLAPNGDSMTAFYAEISSLQENIRTFNDNVSRIGDLRSRSLNSIDNAAAQRNAAQLEEISEDTSALSIMLKRRIKDLERQGGSGRDGQIRRQQTALVKSKFVEAIQNYQTVEQQYRGKYREKVGKQYKIVKPDATPEEVKAVVDGDQTGQIFTQALMNSSRYGESRAAYREVQERHQDIKRIERTLEDLAHLFNDMSVLVEQQDETINTIESQAATVVNDTETALGYTKKAVVSAEAARRKRRMCFFIILAVLLVVGAVVGIGVWKYIVDHQKK